MKLLLIAGTVEGRELAEFCGSLGIRTLACVATGYGSRLLPDMDAVSVRCGRMEEEEMSELLRREGITLAVDASHPYAVSVTENLAAACREAEVSYVRLLRRETDGGGRAVHVDCLAEAAGRVEEAEGKVLLTTGSKELHVFEGISDKTRLYPRVLPAADSLEKCRQLGIPEKNIIAMQGPFSTEMNCALLRMTGASWLITKEAGQTGGLQEKLDACEEMGVTPIIVGRPVKEDGLSLPEVKKLLLAESGKNPRRRIMIAGIGMGGADVMTAEVRRAIAQADVCLGAKRILEAADGAKERFCAYRPEEIAGWLAENPHYLRPVVLVSGDTGFYSAAGGIAAELKARGMEDIKMLPGLPCVSYFCSRLGIGWEDVKLCSAHGRRVHFISQCRMHSRVFALMGKGEEITLLCRKLLDYGMEQVVVHVGERLSYPDERIVTGAPRELLKERFSDISVVLLYNPQAEDAQADLLLSDGQFIRGKLPMTKEEVRCLALAKLCLCRSAVVYDIGAGTGSVAVQAARLVPEGEVWAVEREDEGCCLIASNRKKFRADNLHIVHGEAPEVLSELPAPTHAFIGGSGGRLAEIVRLLMDKNPRVRIVASAVTLETMAELTALSKVCEASFIQVAVTRGRPAGPYHLMAAESPIMLAELSKKEADE